MDMLSFSKAIISALATNDLNKVLDAAYQNIGLPITITDTAYFVRAMAPHKKIGDPYWDAQQEYGYTPNNLVLSCYRNGYMDAIYGSETPTVINWGDVKYPRISCGIRSNGELIGFMAIYCVNNLLDTDVLIEATATLSNACSIFLERGRDSNSLKDSYSFQNLFVQSLFEGKRFSPQEINEWSALSNIPLSENYVVFAINNTAGNDGILSYLESRLREIHKHWLFYKNDRTCYYLATSISSEKELEKISQSIIKQLQPASIKCGSSGLFTDLTKLTKYMYQAGKALEYSFVLDKEFDLYEYDEVRDTVILSYACTVMDRDNYLHPLLMQLEEYDTLYNTQYFNTLKIYLNNLCNSQATADALNVHRNTILYRINKISEICDCNLSDMNLCRQLLLCVQMLELENKLQNKI